MEKFMEIFENTIDSLYNGKLNINEKIPISIEYKVLQKESNELLKKIENNLDKEGKKILNEFIEKKSQITSIECKEKFIEGYKLASKLIIAGIK